ncbi:methyltransferase [Streptomyces sp. NPDC055107]
MQDNRVQERFDLIVNGPALFNAVVAGLELGVFRYVSAHPGADAAQIGDALGLPAHQLRVLLFSLCGSELLCRKADGYVNSGFAEENLTDEDESSWTSILLGWQKIYYPAFAESTEALRTGTNTALARYTGSSASLYQRLGDHPGLQRVLHRSMTAFTLRTMPGLVDHLDLAGVEHVLDVGGGDGITARRLAESNPDVRFTVFDTPSVAEIGRERAPEGVTGRISHVGGDIFTGAFPRPVDCVLFSHCLEVFDADEIRTLLTKAFDALPVDGRVAVYGFNAADDEQRGVYGARLALYLNVLATGQGMAYPAEDYERWLVQAGFVDVRTRSGLPFEHGLTTGVKR